MTHKNPYVQNLIEMGYDEQDVTVASEMFQKHSFPKTIHGRYFNTEEEYFSAIYEYFNGL